MAFQNFYTKNDPNYGWRAGALFIYTPALPPSQMYGGSAPMPPLTVRPCGFPQSVVTPGEIKPPATANRAAARVCPATTPKRRQWRKQQGVVGAALQYLQGRKSRRKYWLSARDPAPQVGPPLALSWFFLRGKCRLKNQSAAPTTAPSSCHWQRSLLLPRGL